MAILEIIKSKLDESIDVENLIDRLNKEISIEGYYLYEVILDVIMIMLNYTNQEKIDFFQRTTLINMIKDYCDLKGYNKGSIEEEDSLSRKIKSINVGDTTTTFVDAQSQININGTTYNTGTIEFDKNILIEKYVEELNKYRKIRW